MRIQLAGFVLTLMLAPCGYADESIPGPCANLVEALYRDDVAGAVSLLLATEAPSSEQDSKRLDQIRRYLEQSLEARSRDLGALQEVEPLDRRPEDASWLLKSEWGLKREKPEDPDEFYFLGRFAYYGVAYLQAACADGAIVEYGIGMPGSDPESRRRIAEINIRETTLLHEIFSND